MKLKQEPECTWVGDGEGCHQTVLVGKSYCATHYDRIYLNLLPEMANYIIEKELKDE